MPVRTKTVSRTATECAVLGLLATGGELSGYDLQKRIEGSVGYFWAPVRSQIYAVLPGLVEGGFVRRRDVAQADRPDKQLYRVTPRGKRALREWLEAAPLPPEPDRNVLLLKVFFGDLMAPAALLEQIRQRRREVEELQASLREIEARSSCRPSDFHPALTRKYGLRYTGAIIRWAKEAERELLAR